MFKIFCLFQLKPTIVRENGPYNFKTFYLIESSFLIQDVIIFTKLFVCTQSNGWSAAVRYKVLYKSIMSSLLNVMGKFPVFLQSHILLFLLLLQRWLKSPTMIIDFSLILSILSIFTLYILKVCNCINRNCFKILYLLDLVMIILMYYSLSLAISFLP